MKYKLLLLGTHYAAIDDFFRQMGDSFELLSTSMHFADIKGHVKYFQPDAVVYCLHEEAKGNIIKMITLKQDNKNAEVPVIILGDEDDCADFNKVAANIADLSLIKPLTATMITERIIKYLDDLVLARQIMEQERQAALEAEEAAREAKKEAENASGKEEPKNEEKAVPAPPADGKKRILIVDDDVRILKVIKRHVEEEEYVAATAVNGGIALRYLENKHADLILLDYEMPDMSGPEVLEKIREKSEWARIPVLFLTGAAEREKIQKALAMKPQGYLLKPVNKDTLMAKIKELLG